MDDRQEPFSATLADSGVCFPVRPGERILGAARRAGVWLPYECGWGSCSSCKATLVEGSVELLFPDAPALDARDERRRRVLLCQTTPTSDVVLKAQRVGDGPDPVRPTRDLSGVVEMVEALGPGVARFILRLVDAAGDRVEADFRPGQYAMVQLSPGLRRCYSLANLPGTDRIELIAKHYEGKPGSTRLFGLVSGDRVPLELPYGDMWLRPGERPVLLVAGGTGISAILALVRLLAEGAPEHAGRRVRVLYGAASRDDLVCWDELVELVAGLPDATLHGALVAPEADWEHTHGFVTHAIENLAESGEHHDLGDSDVYLAGPPVMVAAVQESLASLGIQLDRTYVDSFG
jgi:toluene monooxygenase electron transfer component